ncbi:hypothetical protein MPL3365_410012 [Mesorhizobium plurifarium]|uniref:Uncharacterized protein n=1 Tax=Mesorhizobium plurifarium TaxID=69974 RepID=A0A090GAH3_MESPL|nr:hypothetical protein MPL3365_410012 [Mesorhizobium plurifarium]
MLTKGKHGSNLPLELSAPLSGLHPSHAGPIELRLWAACNLGQDIRKPFGSRVTGPPTDRRSGILLCWNMILGIML